MTDYSPRGTPLDDLLLEQGEVRCRQQFRRMAANRRGAAVAAVNHEQLFFPTLYVLLPEVESLGLLENLSTRNKVAAILCARTLENNSLSQKLARHQHLEDVENRYIALKWMLETSISQDGNDPGLDRIIDMAAAVLIKTYGDAGSVEPVLKLIFSRNRQGLFNHDLIWAYFRWQKPEALRMLADYLRSPDAQDNALAQKLLGPNLANANGGAMPEDTYRSFTDWLEENTEYIYFTGEDFQFSSAPQPCDVNLDAKYLCKRVSPDSGKPLTPLTEEEKKQLENFHQIPPDEQEKLSKLSNQMFSHDPSAWNKWIQTPVVVQVDAMKAGQGGAQWY